MDSATLTATASFLADALETHAHPDFEDTRSNAELYNEYMPVITIDDTSDEEMSGAASATADPTDPTHALATAELRSRLSTSLDFSAVSGELAAAIAAVASTLASDEQSSQSAWATAEQMDAPATIRAIDEQISQPLMDEDNFEQGDAIGSTQACAAHMLHTLAQEAGDDLEKDAAAATSAFDEQISQPTMGDAAWFVANHQDRRATMPTPAQISWSISDEVPDEHYQMGAGVSTDTEPIAGDVAADLAKACVAVSGVASVPQAPQGPMQPIPAAGNSMPQRNARESHDEEAGPTKDIFQEGRRGWFPCATCSRRSKQVPKRRIEDEGDPLSEQSAKRCRA